MVVEAQLRMRRGNRSASSTSFAHGHEINELRWMYSTCTVHVQYMYRTTLTPPRGGSIRIKTH